MQIADFDFDLPAELIAQQPLARRESSRMLVVNRPAGSIADRNFTDLSGFLNPGDVLVLNNTRVFPARLIGQTETGANVEVFLVNEEADGTWMTLARPARRLAAGKQIIFSDDLTGVVMRKAEDGKVGIRFQSDGDFYAILDRIGKTPLPPYIKRDALAMDTDRDRYQTVFARTRGAIAAPTAGLHFTPEILALIRAAGISVVEITLHVGYGTFEPVRVQDLTNHAVSPEGYEIDAGSAKLLNQAKSDERRIIAIGTTTTRALESNFKTFAEFRPGAHVAEVTIIPGFNFQVVRILLTNFHLPKSSLLVLTSTFGGHELIMDAYRHAVANRYRFYSYGDCMLIC